MPSDIQKVNRKNLEAFREFGGEIKHAARELLWLPEAKSLKDERKRFLRYFTLPGKWAWDIFFFELNGVIQRDAIGFPDVRFCDTNSESYLTAKKVLGGTIGIREAFESLVLRDKMEFWDGFPYDIYNLDFCGTCFPNEQPPFSNTFAAIDKIIEKHAHERHFPFVIFLTMKALERETKAEATRQLMDNIETNRTRAEFAAQIDTLIPDNASFVRDRFADFLTVSIPKVICHLAAAHCKVEVRYRAKYKRRGSDGAYFITKFVFKFSRRRRRTLRIVDENYVENILNILELGDVMIIDRSCINARIRTSLSRLKGHVMGLV